MNTNLKIRSLWSRLSVTVFSIGFCLSSVPAFTQISSVNCVQNLSFGAFSQGSAGGTISISADGYRAATGSVVPLNLGVNYFQAIFEIEAPEGTIISIMNGGNSTLFGSNGGTMTLQIGSANPASPFAVSVPQPGKTRVNVGGTLTIGSPAQNPPGNYNGTFFITFNNE
jgi:hypothetical protein